MKAPRGPIKAKGDDAPLVPGTLGSQKCSAKSSRTGKPCQRWAILGGTVCPMHGGSAPQVKAAAQLRIEDLRPKAIAYMDWLLSQRDYPSAGLGAAKDALDRNDGKPTEKVDVNLSGEADLIAALYAGRKRATEGSEV